MQGIRFSSFILWFSLPLRAWSSLATEWGARTRWAWWRKRSHFWHAIWTSHLRCRNKLHQFRSILLALFDILNTLLTDVKRPAAVDVFIWSLPKEVHIAQAQQTHSQFMCAYLWLPAASLAALKFQFPAADRKWKFCQITVSAVRDDCEWKIIRCDFLRCQKSIADELNLFSPSNPFNWLESNLICHSIHRSNRNSFKKNLGGPGLLFLRMCNQLLLCMRGLRCGTAVGIVIDIVLSECGLHRRNINNYPSRQVIKLLFTVKTNKEKGERVAGKDLQWW